MGFYLNKGILNYLIYFSLQILFITMMDFDPSANSKEYLWSTKLTKKSNKTQWEGRDDGVLEQLVLKRACLGVGAKENERNIVQVTSFNYQQKKIETCICSLTLPTKECDGLTDVTVFPPAIFELVEGSGPIHLTGNHMMMDDGDESDDEDFDEEGMEEDEEVSEDSDGAEEEEEEEEAKIVEIKSDPPPAKVNGVAEKKQVAEVKPQVKDETPADEESKEEEEEKMEAEVEETPAPVVEEKPKKTPKKNKKRKLEEKPAEENVEAAPAAAEEKPKTPAKKKKAAAAAAEGATEEAPKTPKNKQKENKTPKKTPAKVYTTLDEVAAAVKKYPGGKPRKEDKFGNWVKSAFKVHNDEWIPQLWKMHKKDAGL